MMISGNSGFIAWFIPNSQEPVNKTGQCSTEEESGSLKMKKEREVARSEIRSIHHHHHNQSRKVNFFNQVIYAFYFSLWQIKNTGIGQNHS